MVRILRLFIVLFFVFALCRWMIRLLPGDPIETLLLESGTQVPVEQIRAELGLDRPYWQSLGSDLLRWGGGDFGTSLRSRQPIAPLLWSALFHSTLLATTAFMFSLIWSLFVGTLAALGEAKDTRLKWISNLVSAQGALSSSLPAAWLGPVLIYFFCVSLGWFEITGSLPLAALILSFYLTGFWTRLVRLRVRESLTQLYARTLESQGASTLSIAIQAGLKPALGGLLAYFGTQLGGLLGGAFLVETLLDWPGLGELLVDSILKRDYTVVQVSIFWSALLALLGTTLGDLSQRAFDPRTRT